MVEFVTLSDIQKFSYNPIIGQHKLRYEAITKRQGWDVPCYKGLEFDQYDNPAAKYLVCRNDKGDVVGSSRLYPTTLPYMLEESFPHFVTHIDLPKSDTIWEGSRFCIARDLPSHERREIAKHLVIGYLEAGLSFGIEAIVGIMYPAYWRHLFIQNGWDLDFIGDVITLQDGYKARAGLLPVSESVLDCVRKRTRVFETVLNFGEVNAKDGRKAA